MIVHLDGRLIPAAEARVSAFDRGFMFGDGLYEGIRVAGGAALGMEHHIARLRAGLREARITGFDPERLRGMSRELLGANALEDALLYWQVTRGAPEGIGEGGAAPDGRVVRARIPPVELRPTVLGVALPLPGLETYVEPASRAGAVVRDTRWLRGHVKSISLMGSVLSAFDARDAGAEEAILVRDGFVTEGVATNVTVALDGRLITPPVEGGRILEGVTRRRMLDAEPRIEVAPVRVEDLARASEIMLTGAATVLVSITSLDGRPVGDGRVGPEARGLLKRLVEGVKRERGESTG